MTSVNITVALLTAMIISMILFAIIHEVENEIDELRKDLEWLNVEQNEKNFKHMVDIVDEAIKNKDNMFGVGVSDAEFRTFIINYLLGEDWYVVDPLGQTQINEIALHEILKKYSKRYRKECKNRK